MATNPVHVVEGTCSACGSAATQIPNGKWWHRGAACPNRSMTVFQVAVVEDGVMRSTTPAERPAEFIPKEEP